MTGSVFMTMRNGRFTFVCNDQERRGIAELAARLQRSQSDAVRIVVLNAVKSLTAPEPPAQNEQAVNVQV